MPKPHNRQPQTRILNIDGDLYLILARRADCMLARKLTGKDRELAEKLLDDIQFEIEAHILGYEGPES